MQEKIAGKTGQRPELQTLLDQRRKGDVVIIAEYDRLARSLKDLIEIVKAFRERGVGLSAHSPAQKVEVRKEHTDD